MDEGDIGLAAVLEAWRRTRFPQQLTTITENTDNLFSGATAEQRVAYRAERARHLANLRRAHIEILKLRLDPQRFMRRNA